MQHRFDFPVPLDCAVAVLRRERRFDQVHGNSHQNIVGYTDRNQAVSGARKSNSDCTSGEVCLVVVELDDCMVMELLHGDFTHYGPTARWLSPQALELEHVAQERLSHEGRFSLEIVNG